MAAPHLVHCVVDTSGTVVNPGDAVNNAIRVNVVAGSGGGGGVQYTEGDVDASVTGTAVMWKDAGNVLRTATSGTPLPVTISGTVDTISRILGSQLSTVQQFTLLNGDPLGVAIVDGNGDQITSFGGGTQYTEGDTPSPIIGTALVLRDSNTGTDIVAATATSAPGGHIGLDVTIINGSVDVICNGFTTLTDNFVNPAGAIISSAFNMLWDGANWDRAPGNSADGMLVNLGANNDVTVTAANLDIRDLVFATDKVDASGSVVSTKTDLTPSSPATATIGTSSASAVAAAATRRGLHLRNTSTSGQRISLGFGAAAVLDSGVTLYPQDVFEMDEYSFDVGAVNAISSAASGRLSIQEYLT